jgi:drug/metabolite transporter (DMT)-like permease
MVLARLRPRVSRSELTHVPMLSVSMHKIVVVLGLSATDISATSLGFLTGTMVALTPLMAGAVFGERVSVAGWVAVLMAMCGIGLLMLPWWTIGLGAVLTVGGAACFALHIAGLSRWATSANARGLTALSVAVAAGLCGAAAIMSGSAGSPPTPSAWRSVLYLAIVATCVGFAVQAWAQSGLSATQAAVVMTLEPVFAAALAAAVGGEHLLAVAIAGGLIVVALMFVAELGPRECCDAMSPRIECC